MTFILANIVGAIAVILSMIGLQQNNGKRFLFFQIIINLLYTAQYLLLNATAGLCICLINTIRCVMFYFYKKNKKTSVFLFLFFIAIYLFLGIYTLENLIDIILIFGTIVYTYSLWQNSMKITRIGSLVSIFSYIIYNINVKAYSALVLDFLDLFSILIAIMRYDVFKRRKIMIIKKFSKLTKEELDKIINKHYSHWSQYSPTMDFENTKSKFENIYTKNDSIPFGIAMFEEDRLIGFLVFKPLCLEKYPQYTPWISDVMIFDEFRGQGYGSKLIGEALKMLNDLGYKKAYLWTDKAPGFYEKIGFKFEHEVEKNEGGTGRLYSKEI